MYHLALFSPKSKHYYEHHFKDREIEAEKLNDLSKVTQASDQNWILTQDCLYFNTKVKQQDQDILTPESALNHNPRLLPPPCRLLVTEQLCRNFTRPPF